MRKRPNDTVVNRQYLQTFGQSMIRGERRVFRRQGLLHIIKRRVFLEITHERFTGAYINTKMNPQIEKKSRKNCGQVLEKFEAR